MSRTRTATLFASTIAALTFVAAAVAVDAQTPATNASRVAALGLPSIERDGLMLAYSRGAEAEADFYAGEAAAAIAWYHRTLVWDRGIAMAVLDAADYAATTQIPYPSPHAETRTRFIIIADHVESHPGFDLWDIDGRAINAAWLFHEMGHVIASDLGIASANAWVNELIASVFMAGYVAAERPAFAGFQQGMPPRFANANRFRSLADFDNVYFGMGQSDYLWFHLHIAAMADHLVAAAGGLAAAVEGLWHAFPAAERRPREPIARTLERLEGIGPGITALAADLM